MLIILKILDNLSHFASLLDKVTAPEADSAKETFDTLFVSSDAAGCDNIEQIFKARVEANPTDVTTLGKAFTLLMRSECHTAFLTEVGEMYYNADPTAATAKLVASAFVKVGDNAKAVSFLKAAFDKETDPLNKATLAVEIAARIAGEDGDHAAAERRQHGEDGGHRQRVGAQGHGTVL